MRNLLSLATKIHPRTIRKAPPSWGLTRRAITSPASITGTIRGVVFRSIRYSPSQGVQKACPSASGHKSRAASSRYSTNWSQARCGFALSNRSCRYGHCHSSGVAGPEGESAARIRIGLFQKTPNVACLRRGVGMQHMGAPAALGSSQPRHPQPNPCICRNLGNRTTVKLVLPAVAASSSAPCDSDIFRSKMSRLCHGAAQTDRNRAEAVGMAKRRKPYAINLFSTAKNRPRPLAESSHSVWVTISYMRRR